MLLAEFQGSTTTDTTPEGRNTWQQRQTPNRRNRTLIFLCLLILLVSGPESNERCGTSEPCLMQMLQYESISTKSMRFKQGEIPGKPQFLNAPGYGYRFRTISSRFRRTFPTIVIAAASRGLSSEVSGPRGSVASLVALSMSEDKSSRVSR